MTNSDSRARDIMRYSFLRVFANDRTIDAGELAFLERLALQDNVVDDAEKDVLATIFNRVTPEMVSPDVWLEMEQFRQRFSF